MSQDKELAAMITISGALDVFDEEEQPVVQRILKWACDRYSVEVTRSHDPGESDSDSGFNQGSSADIEFKDIADLYDAARPKTDVERALVAGYWMNVGEGKPEFVSQDANTHLKNLGHGLNNITDSLNSLKARKPALVMQTAKSGKSKQARKKYKLTAAGHNRMKEMLGRPLDGSSK